MGYLHILLHDCLSLHKALHLMLSCSSTPHLCLRHVLSISDLSRVASANALVLFSSVV